MYGRKEGGRDREKGKKREGKNENKKEKRKKKQEHFNSRVGLFLSPEDWRNSSRARLCFQLLMLGG